MLLLHSKCWIATEHLHLPRPIAKEANSVFIDTPKNKSTIPYAYNDDSFKFFGAMERKLRFLFFFLFMNIL